MAAPGEEKTPLAASFACAWHGIAHAARGRNFKIQLGFACAACVLGALAGLAEAVGGFDGLALSLGEWLVVGLCIALVLSGECFNTALEAIVDLASPGRHELARIAKDCAAGAVLLSSAVALVVGIVLFAPRILLLVRTLFAM